MPGLPGPATGPAGPGWLADDASGQDRDFEGATDDQLLGVLGARARLEARAAWERLTAVAELIRRSPAAGCALAGPGRMPRVRAESAAAELRAQLHLSPRGGQRAAGPGP
jgi:hypothetical protein